ncbi:MAG: MFS transporter [Ignavibacteria bacterium]|nr:MFS transporter [Ignavibacteria bacterium]
MKTFINKKILILALISFFTDVASEMLYPILPLFLKSIGFSILVIGILESIAEAISGLSKGYFGALSDKLGSRVLFVRLGYFLSSIAKPLIGLFPLPMFVFFFRTIDRFGKGIRTAPRDALLSDESQYEHKGKVFGFHRAFDTLGAVVGPSLTILLLTYFIADYRTIFLLSVVPGVIVLLLCFTLKEQKKEKKAYSTSTIRTNVSAFLKYYQSSSKKYKEITFPLLFFTLFKSSEFFLLLKLDEYGISSANIVFFYILLNVSYAIFSFPAGRLADKVGFKKVISFGLLSFSCAYLSINLSNDTYWLAIVFIIYGIFSASYEGMVKAYITNRVPHSETATALGTFSAFTSVISLLSSSLTGTLWSILGSTCALLFSAFAGLITFVYFAIFLKD